MNQKQESELIELVINHLIDATYLYNVKKYSLKAYGNPNNTKIVITFQNGDIPLDNITVDYYQQIILEDCNGVNVEDDYVLLNCDLINLREIGYIKYYIDQNLTDKLNEKFERQ